MTKSQILIDPFFLRTGVKGNVLLIQQLILPLDEKFICSFKNLLFVVSKIKKIVAIRPLLLCDILNFYMGKE